MEASARLVAGIVTVALLLPLLAAPAAADNLLPEPLPQGSAAIAAPSGLADEATLAGRTLELTVAYAGGQALRAAAEMQAGLAHGQVVVPLSHANSIITQGGQDGAAMVRHAAAMASVIIALRNAQAAETMAFASLVQRAAEHKVGVSLSVPPQQEGVLPTAPAACVTDPQAALDAAAEGADILVCAGTYQGPLVVRQHFVTLRSEQGPLATVVEAGQGRGIVVEATGVTVKGFTVQGASAPGGVGILVGGADEAYATVLQDNLVRRNAVGVEVRNAGSTLLLHNTIRDQARTGSAGGVGVLVTSPAEADAAGVIVAGNNFVNNGRYAVQAAGAVPVVALLNYYGQATGPNLELAGQCVGASALAGSPLCRNGVGAGVLLAGFSPVPL